ncbi:MAG: hypothetical protein ACJ77K_15885 [Bacteroidia bacterium]
MNWLRPLLAFSIAFGINYLYILYYRSKKKQLLKSLEGSNYRLFQNVHSKIWMSRFLKFASWRQELDVVQVDDDLILISGSGLFLFRKQDAIRLLTVDPKKTYHGVRSRNIIVFAEIQYESLSLRAVGLGTRSPDLNAVLDFNGRQIDLEKMIAHWNKAIEERNKLIKT